MTNDSRLNRIFLRLLGQRRTVNRPDAAPGRRASDVEPLRGWRPALLIGLGIAVVDWITKWMITSSMAIGDFTQVIEGRVAFWHVRNPAMILGLWENFPLGARKVLAVTAAVLGALVLLQIVGRAHRLPRHHRRWAWLFVGMVLGGMMGNLGERLIHWGVTDYLSFRYGEYWLPPGNVADLSLFLSVPMAIPVVLFELMGRARRGRGAVRPPMQTGGRTSGPQPV
ncbi:signal peptidase II [Longimicrobium sp.]|uniref:signal peptidase II n=1 Tax=Longimicrobium sp. TaxID=2029185 RepID=UPI002E35DC26|nr:signal peptidase II [Longimicrobium sp.]HEX6040771.1 signal peptidase II [Longimicrobium sp.]